MPQISDSLPLRGRRQRMSASSEGKTTQSRSRTRTNEPTGYSPAVLNRRILYPFSLTVSLLWSATQFDHLRHGHLPCMRRAQLFNAGSEVTNPVPECIP